MDTKGIPFTFSAKVWYSDWYFVTLPVDVSTDIRALFKQREEGWGRLKVTAKIGGSEWETAIWFGTQQQAYLLPVKKDIRTKEKIGIDAEVTVQLWI